jgi:hypothetical protein
MLGTRLSVAGSSLLFLLAAQAALAQDTTTSGEPPLVDPAVVVDPMPQTTTPDPEPEPTDTTTTPPEPGGPAVTTPTPPPASPAYGNAALQPPAAKRAEAGRACVPQRPPISQMLAVGGSVGRDEGGSWGLVVIGVAIAALTFALGAFLRRRFGRRVTEKPPPRGSLELAATMVGMFGVLAGLAVQFIPGVGARERPAPEATMTVREVHARITRGEYAKKTGVEQPPSRIDRREVGDVVWLQIGLRGYKGKRPVLQYGLYNPDLGGALLPGTGKTVGIRVEDSDMQTLFVPIWVGFPSSERFQVKFRLLEGERVRQLASTPKMKASKYRYSCRTPS